MTSWVPLSPLCSLAPSGRAASPSVVAAPAGGRSCQLSPLQAVALAMGLPLAASQWTIAPCGLAAGVVYARRCRPYKRQPCPRAVAPAGDCPLRDSWPCKGL
ncbi:hypothetical protein B296_00019482 [Ensete ventricosum]|uniref:Uncharacterized protein n=1 Tax=Ensete ventricosum TaxID=4639 RepID=A0A426Y1R1_ENSVE|nr:hypothetical protein B296_00019482 [Ensete ventricosum]